MRSAVPVVAPRLRPGDVVRIVAPAGPLREGELEAGLAVLSRRYVPRWDEGLLARDGFLAGDDARRAAELTAALSDPEAKGVLAMRGGFGTMRILPEIAPVVAALRAAPKTVIGSSDLTALGCALLGEGIGWVHGPMVRTLGRTDEATIDRFWRVLEAPETVDDALPSLRAVAPGRAQGPLVGGNLSVLTALIGTPWAPQLAGAIVFLEDVGERSYRLDRLMAQLRLAGALSGAAGFLLGDLTDCSCGDGEPKPEEVLIAALRPLGVPIVAGFPAAHGAQSFALRMGEVVEIDGGQGTFRTRVP